MKYVKQHIVREDLKLHVQLVVEMVNRVEVIIVIVSRILITRAKVIPNSIVGIAITDMRNILGIISNSSVVLARKLLD